MHHLVTNRNVHTYAHFCYKIMHFGIFACCIMWFVRYTLLMRSCLTWYNPHHKFWSKTKTRQWGQNNWNNIYSHTELNPLRANFFGGNINIYLHFMSLLHIDITQVLKIIPHVRPGLTYSTQSISWLLMSWRHKERERLSLSAFLRTEDIGVHKEPGHQHLWYWPS